LRRKVYGKSCSHSVNASTELGFRFREFTLKDVNRISEIRQKSLAEEFEIFGSGEESPLKTFLRYRLSSFIERLTGKVFERLYVGEVLGDIVGTVILSRDGQRWTISGVMVDPKHRRRGYGKRLVSEACKVAERLGAKKIYLSVLETNAPARALYRFLGFEDFDKKLYFYKDLKIVEKRILHSRYKIAKLRDAALFKLFTLTLKQKPSERFAIFNDDKEPVGTLVFNRGYRSKVVIVSINLSKKHSGVGLEESLLAIAFEQTRRKGATRVLVKVDDPNQELGRACNRLGLKLLCVVRDLSLNFDSASLFEIH